MGVTLPAGRRLIYPLLAAHFDPMLTGMRSLGLSLLALGAVFAVAMLPPLPMPPAGMTLSDRRTLFGVPNFMDVVSNLPFLAVGAWGLYLVATARRAFVDPAERAPYAALFMFVLLTAAGSAYFHLSPDDDRLMWDRLPIALGFMALVSAVIVDRVDARIGVSLLGPLLVAGGASVLYWRWSVGQGTENLLPYAVVQFGAMAAVLTLALFYRSRYTRGGDVLVAIAIYFVAKAAEVMDAAIFERSGALVSGHTLKHLIAALGVAWLARMLRLRSPL